MAERQWCPRCGHELLTFMEGSPCCNAACDPIWGLVSRDDDQDISDDQEDF